MTHQDGRRFHNIARDRKKKQSNQDGRRLHNIVLDEKTIEELTIRAINRNVVEYSFVFANIKQK